MSFLIIDFLADRHWFVKYSALHFFLHFELIFLAVFVANRLSFRHFFLHVRLDFPFLPLHFFLQCFFSAFAICLASFLPILQTFLQSLSPLHAARDFLIETATSFPPPTQPLIANAHEAGPAQAFWVVKQKTAKMIAKLNFDIDSPPIDFERGPYRHICSLRMTDQLLNLFKIICS